MADTQKQQIEQATSLIVEAILATGSFDTDRGDIEGRKELDESIAPAVRLIVEAAALEPLKRLRIALRSLAEQSHRSERERTLIHDLVEELGGSAAG